LKYWKTIVNKMMKAGFSVGWVSALDVIGVVLLIAAAAMRDTAKDWEE
jgi:hypothetical protein